MVLKNFDRFRKDLTVLSGFYNATYTFRGDVRLEPKSLSFGSMCEEEFGQRLSRNSRDLGSDAAAGFNARRGRCNGRKTLGYE